MDLLELIIIIEDFELRLDAIIELSEVETSEAVEMGQITLHIRWV